MDLHLPTAGLDRYKSVPQRVRVGTESWGATNLFCPSCDSPHLEASPRNTAAIDYLCPNCASPYQLKSQSKKFGSRIVDAAYSQMRKAILEDHTPNLYLLHYDIAAWSVRNVILVPHFAFALSALQRRKPLAPTARRAGWVGCDILLDKIPQDARIPVILDGQQIPARDVRRRYDRLRPLAKLQVEKRGWTLDVLQIVRSLNKAEFSLPEVYAHEARLSKLHPDNRHVRDKIRQQLQILRDLGLLQFLSPGHYRFL